MNLIDNIYKQRNLCEQEDVVNLIISGIDEENFSNILRYTYLFDDDLRYEDVKNKINLIFNRLGLKNKDFVVLYDMMVFNSRFNSNKIGSISFDYSTSMDVDYIENNNITYYHNGEMFDGNDRRAFSAGIKISSGNTSLYYEVGHTHAQLVKYEIVLDSGVKLVREFSNSEVFFIFEGIDHRFIIKIDRKNDNNYFILKNEHKLLKYLINISSYDVDKIYDKLCEICLGSCVSEYSEITLCETKKIANKWKEVNLLVLRKGNVYEFVKTVGNKMITVDNTGNWKYYLEHGSTEITINNQDVVSYSITSLNEEIMDDYIDNLFMNDTNEVKDEVKKIKRLILEKYSVKQQG